MIFRHVDTSFHRLSQFNQESETEGLSRTDHGVRLIDLTQIPVGVKDGLWSSICSATVRTAAKQATAFPRLLIETATAVRWTGVFFSCPYWSLFCRRHHRWMRSTERTICPRALNRRNALFACRDAGAANHATIASVSRSTSSTPSIHSLI